jgi:hypothetical protein
MSLCACLLVGVVITTGWEGGLKDEGAAAHLWRLLIVLQVPLIAAFLFTSDWRRPGEVAKTLVLQIAALGLAIAPVALFQL